MEVTPFILNVCKRFKSVLSPSLQIIRSISTIWGPMMGGFDVHTSAVSQRSGRESSTARKPAGKSRCVSDNLETLHAQALAHSVLDAVWPGGHIAAACAKPPQLDLSPAKEGAPPNCREAQPRDLFGPLANRRWSADISPDPRNDFVSTWDATNTQYRSMSLTQKRRSMPGPIDPEGVATVLYAATDCSRCCVSDPRSLYSAAQNLRVRRFVRTSFR